MDLPTITALTLLSLLLTWVVAAYLDSRQEEKREKARQKALERLGVRNLDSFRDDVDDFD